MWEFANQHPFLTTIIAVSLIGGIVSIVQSLTGRCPCEDEDIDDEEDDE